MELDGTAYFCTVRALFVTRPTNPQPVEKVGLVVALKDLSKTRRLLDGFDTLQELFICLHDYENVLVSNRPEWEGKAAEEVINSPDPVYRRDISFMPGSLGVIVSIPESQLFPNRPALMFTLLMVGAFALLLLFMTGAFVSRFIVRPFSQVMAEFAVLGGRPMNHRLSKTGAPDVDKLMESINEMIANIEEYSRQAFAVKQNLYEMEISQRETQMYLLRNQIDRHFLYNSLISIKTLANHGENEKVEEVVEGIAKLMRFITSKTQEVNIFDEMEITRRYVNIQNIRFGNNTVLEIDVDDRLCQYKILKLLIQPLVENAFVHGLEPERGGGILNLRGSLADEDSSVIIEVEDNGAGITPERLALLQNYINEADTIAIHQDLEGVALINIEKRIRLAYGNEYGLTISSRTGSGTLARLRLPALPDN